MTIYAWARADSRRALEHLGELVDTGGIDLPATLWALIGADGPGVDAVAEAAAPLPHASRKAIVRALRRAGADGATLRAFEQDDRGFPWMESGYNVETAIRPRWAIAA
jgi:hypothetical protein